MLQRLFRRKKPNPLTDLMCRVSNSDPYRINTYPHASSAVRQEILRDAMVGLKQGYGDPREPFYQLAKLCFDDPCVEIPEGQPLNSPHTPEEATAYLVEYYKRAMVIYGAQFEYFQKDSHDVSTPEKQIHYCNMASLLARAHPGKALQLERFALSAVKNFTDPQTLGAAFYLLWDIARQQQNFSNIALGILCEFEQDQSVNRVVRVHAEIAADAIMDDMACLSRLRKPAHGVLSI